MCVHACVSISVYISIYLYSNIRTYIHTYTRYIYRERKREMCMCSIKKHFVLKYVVFVYI